MTAPSWKIKALRDAGVIRIEIYLQPSKMLIWISRMYFMIYLAGNIQIHRINGTTQ
jgi:hypothetical protein